MRAVANFSLQLFNSTILQVLGKDQIKQQHEVGALLFMDDLIASSNMLHQHSDLMRAPVFCIPNLGKGTIRLLQLHGHSVDRFE